MLHLSHFKRCLSHFSHHLRVWHLPTSHLLEWILRHLLRRWHHWSHWLHTILHIELLSNHELRWRHLRPHLIWRSECLCDWHLLRYEMLLLRTSEVTWLLIKIILRRLKWSCLLIHTCWLEFLRCYFHLLWLTWLWMRGLNILLLIDIWIFSSNFWVFNHFLD